LEGFLSEEVVDIAASSFDDHGFDVPYSAHVQISCNNYLVLCRCAVQIVVANHRQISYGDSICELMAYNMMALISIRRPVISHLRNITDGCRDLIWRTSLAKVFPWALEVVIFLAFCVGFTIKRAGAKIPSEPGDVEPCLISFTVIAFSSSSVDEEGTLMGTIACT
jgi:hypothetical protein